MREHAATTQAIAKAFRCGTVERGDGRVDLWRVTDIHSQGMRTVSWLFHTPDGGLQGFSASRHVGDEHVLPRDAERVERGFGLHLARLLGAVGRMDDDAEDEFRPGIGSPAALASMYMREAAEAEWEDVARRAVREPLAAVADRFLAGLDPVALDAFTRHSRQFAHLGRMLDGSDPGSPLPAALALHPGFPNALRSLHLALGTRGLSDTLAAGRLTAALAKHLRGDGAIDARTASVAAAAERALSGRAGELMAVRHGGFRDLRDLFKPEANMPDWPVALAARLSSFPAPWVPADDAQWWALARLWPVMEQVARTYDDPPMAIAFPSGGDWVGLLGRLVTAAGVDGPDGLGTALANAGDMVEAYARQVVAAAAHADGSQPACPDRGEGEWAARHDRAAVAVLQGGRSLARLLEMSADWHRRQHRMRTTLSALPGALPVGRWQAGLGDAAYGDVEVRVLADATALADEGAPGPDADGVPGLNNCVGGYDARCLDGECTIVSLRRHHPDGTWSRLSVAEVSLEYPPDFEVLQHMGRGNGPAPEGMDGILDRYLADCRAGIVECDTDGFHPVHQEEATAAARVCGFDPTVEATRLAVARMWDRWVPAPLRDLDDDALARLDIADDGRPWPAAMPVPRTEPGTGAAPRP